MIYSVRARLIDEQAAELHRNLNNGLISQGRPDGDEIAASMERARITDDGYVRWTETCFCPTPLQHEREVQLDRYFSEIETALIQAHKIFEGSPLITHLAAKAFDNDIDGKP